MPWTLLFSFLSGIPGAIGQYFQQANQLAIQKLQTQQALQLAAQQAASELAKSQAELDKIIVQSTGSGFKYFTFFMWFGPFMIGIISPVKAAAIFANLSQMPVWYVQSCMLIMFTIWGISVSAPVVNNIFSGLTQYLSDRRQDKIEMIKAKVDPKSYFDTVRKIKGHLSDQDVKEGNEILQDLNASSPNDLVQAKE